MQSNSTKRRRLSDILDGKADELRRQWDQTEAAGDFAPLPKGEYVAHVETVEPHKAKTGTPGVKITFRVIDGERAGRLLWHDLWLTEAAMRQTKRDLAKLGITSLDQLDDPPIPPSRIRCHVRVGQRTGDDGTLFNRVRSFTVVGIDEPRADPFAPVDEDAAEQECETPEAAGGAP